MINPKDADQKCSKWTVIAALHHKEIGKKSECMLKVQHYEDQCNCNGIVFPLGIQKTVKFENNNLRTTVNVLFDNKKNIYTAIHSSNIRA